MIRRTLAFVGSSLFCATLVFSANGAQAKTGDPAKGKEVFEQCSVCHSADTDEKKMGPSLKGLFKKQKLQSSGQPVTEASVMKQINNGGGGMPAYGDMLSADDKANLIAYLKTL